mmetsp:Transcript_10588/g.17673  ORF Transcript_10588/g.17673 Transcript_10588/m.17673 type:complete len:250 (-) Transcript_10588:3-752(-)
MLFIVLLFSLCVSFGFCVQSQSIESIRKNNLRDGAECVECIDTAISFFDIGVEGVLRLGIAAGCAKFCEEESPKKDLLECVGACIAIGELLASGGFKLLDFDPVYVCGEVGMCPTPNVCDASKGCGAKINSFTNKPDVSKKGVSIDLDFELMGNESFAGTAWLQVDAGNDAKFGHAEFLSASGTGFDTSVAKKSQFSLDFQGVSQFPCGKFPAKNFTAFAFVCVGGCDQNGPSEHGARVLAQSSFTASC